MPSTPGPRTMVEQDFLDIHPRFRAVADYLNAKAPPGRLPGRQHIDPLDLAVHLPFLNLIEVVGRVGKIQFRYRLMGTAQVTAVGRDDTGKTVEETHDPANLALVLQGLHMVLDTRLPNFADRTMPRQNREHVRYQRVMFPLAGDGYAVDMILVVHSYPNL